MGTWTHSSPDPDFEFYEPIASEGGVILLALIALLWLQAAIVMSPDRPSLVLVGMVALAGAGVVLAYFGRGIAAWCEDAVIRQQLRRKHASQAAAPAAG